MGVVVASNAFIMAVEFQLKGETAKDAEVWFVAFDLIFLLAFTVELALRAMVLERKTMLVTNPTLALDSFIVVMGLFSEIILPTFAGQSIFQKFSDAGTDRGASSSSSLEWLDAVKCLRSLRVLRLFTTFEYLWKVTQMFFHALPPLMWTVLFIYLIVFIFSMFAVTLIGRYSNKLSFSPSS